MLDPKQAVREAFLEDHRRLVKGLSVILKALRENDVSKAVEEADRLDQNIGAHIELEEREFYPLLKERLGSELVGQLYEEHAAGKQAITALVDHQGEGALEERADLIEKLELMLAHAESCGSLLSHLDRESGECHATLLERLRAFRRERKRWTECGGD